MHGRTSGLTRRRLGAGVGAVGLAGCVPVAAPGTRVAMADVFPGQDWETVSPAQAGWDEGGVAAARDYSQVIGTASFVVAQHGRIVASWGDIGRRLELHSMRKSLLSALFGIEVGKGRIDLDATLGSLGIDDAPPVLTEAEKRATVRQLLQSRSGVYHEALYETPGEVSKRPPRGSHPPGSFWYYNNWDFNVLGTIFERAAGRSVFAALESDVARPIGMQDYRVSDGRYVRGESTSLFPAYPLRMSARDLARFGLLYARGGVWRGRSVVPGGWVRESTTGYSMTLANSGYGYMWWTGFPDRRVAVMDLPPGGFWADGAHGQFLWVDPGNDLVAAHQTDGVDVSDRQKGHLMWLIQQAARVPDPGSDPGNDVGLRRGRRGRV